MEETLFPNKDEVVLKLVEKYAEPGLSPFIGSFLRLYTKSSKLLGAF